MSQNITLSWRRSASAGGDGSPGDGRTCGRAERKAQLLEILRRQLAQDLAIDLLLDEDGHVLAESDLRQPMGDIVHVAPPSQK